MLDSGGYGAIAISKDVSIIAPKGVYAGITVSAASPNATGVAVYDARVILRGLSINGQGGGTGIHVFGDAVVQIEDCAISSLDQYGVRVEGLLGSPEVFIHTTMIHDIAGHGIYATGGGAPACRPDVGQAQSRRRTARHQRSDGGHHALTASNNVVAGNVVGLRAAQQGVFYTRDNNTVSDNLLPVAGTLSFTGAFRPGIVAQRRMRRSDDRLVRRSRADLR